MKRKGVRRHYLATMGMARLIVNTLPDLNSVAAFVASSEGMPKSGLGLSNFKVRAALPGADGAFLMISEVSPSTLRGFYVLNLSPVESVSRRKGLYVFDLIVEMDEDCGQTVSSVIMT
jgi:hypothetical protein